MSCGVCAAALVIIFPAFPFFSSCLFLGKGRSEGKKREGATARAQGGEDTIGERESHSHHPKPRRCIFGTYTYEYCTTCLLTCAVYRHLYIHTYIHTYIDA